MAQRPVSMLPFQTHLSSRSYLAAFPRPKQYITVNGEPTGSGPGPLRWVQAFGGTAPWMERHRLVLVLRLGYQSEEPRPLPLFPLFSCIDQGYASIANKLLAKPVFPAPQSSRVSKLNIAAVRGLVRNAQKGLLGGTCALYVN